MDATTVSPGSGWTLALIALTAGIVTSLLVWSGTRAAGSMLSPVRRRLAALREGNPAAAEPSVWTRLLPMLERLEPRAEGERKTTRSLLVQAGYRSRSAPGVFYGSKLLLTVLLPALVAAANAVAPQHLKGPALYVLMLAAAGIGFLVPSLFVSRQRTHRINALMEGFPDALDLLVTCTEAGLGFNAALERVAEQLPASYPLLAQELSQVNAEVRAGVDRAAALHNLADRAGLDEISGLVALITQSGRLGTGVATVLRVYAEEFRDRRLQLAEERAALIGTKLIFPLVFTLWPGFFVIAIGPAIVGVIRALSGTPLPDIR